MLVAVGETMSIYMSHGGRLTTDQQHQDFMQATPSTTRPCHAVERTNHWQVQVLYGNPYMRGTTHLHAVQQRPWDGVQHIGCAHEQHLHAQGHLGFSL